MWSLAKLTRWQPVLLINWIIVPALALVILWRLDWRNAGIFLIAWIVADRVWDFLSGLLITGAGAVGANANEMAMLELEGTVPARMGVMMLLDLIVTLLLPLPIAAYFLGW